MRHSRLYLSAARVTPPVARLPAHTVTMPPLDKTQLQSKPFKLRKSFGKRLHRRAARRTGVHTGVTRLFLSLRSYQETRSGRDPVQVPQQDPGKFEAERASAAARPRSHLFGSGVLFFF